MINIHINSPVQRDQSVKVSPQSFYHSEKPQQESVSE